MKYPDNITIMTKQIIIESVVAQLAFAVSPFAFSTNTEASDPIGAKQSTVRTSLISIGIGRRKYTSVAAMALKNTLNEARVIISFKKDFLALNWNITPSINMARNELDAAIGDNIVPTTSGNFILKNINISIKR